MNETRLPGQVQLQIDLVRQNSPTHTFNIFI